jgi:hypothetical protein
MLQDFIVNFPFVWNEPEFTVIFFKLLYYIISMLPIACGTFYVHLISELAVTFERFVVWFQLGSLIFD